MRQDWDTNITETSATDAIDYIASAYASYCNALQAMNDQQRQMKSDLEGRWQRTKDSLQKERENAVNQARSQEQKAIAQLKKDKAERIDTPRKDLQQLKQVNQAASFRQQVADRFFHGSVGNHEQLQAQAERDMQVAMEASRKASIKAVDAIKKAREAAVDEAARSYDYHFAAEQNNHNQQAQQMEEQFGTTRRNMQQKCERTLQQNVGERIRAYRNTVASYRQKGKNYECAKEVPEKIFLGWVMQVLQTNKAAVAEEANALFKRILGDVLISVHDMPAAVLPYVQSVDDGISLFVNYSSADRQKYQKLMQALALKLFMAFPPGRLEATMIDPLELGETFSLLSPLGEEQARVIDTKIWSQAADITTQINILRKRMETLTSSYGTEDAREIRKRKEAYQLLAITDFPNGFSPQALQDLRAIVRKSADYGVMILIFANIEEISKLKKEEQDIIREIYQTLHVASIDEKDPSRQLVLTTADHHSVFLELDMADEIMSHRQSVIKTLARGVHEAVNKIEYFDDMYEDIEDPNSWLNGNTQRELSIPIGIKGANTVVRLEVGRGDSDTKHHVLIAGQTGSGKSTLLHTIICSTLLNYPPDEVQLYLVDFKEGVEFKTWYATRNFPSVKVVAIDCEREFGLNILKELKRQMEDRFDKFSREASAVDIIDYRTKTGKKMPKILVIFDEVQELFGGRQDSITQECTELLRSMLTRCRAAGIHFILASQTLNQLPIKTTLLQHCAIRIALRGSIESAQSVLGEGNRGTEELQNQGAGAAVLNDNSGDPKNNVIFQVAYLPSDKRKTYLDTLSAIQNSDEYRRLYPGKTKILLTNAEDDPFNAFNCLIRDHTLLEPDAEDVTNYNLMIGEGFNLRKKFRINIAPERGQNLLMIGRDVKTAASLFLFSALSLLYGELLNEQTDKNNELIDLIDLSDEDELGEGEDVANFGTLSRDFPEQVRRVGVRQMDDLILNVYERLLRRQNGEEAVTERIFLMIFGMNRARKLVNSGIYADVSDRTSTLAKLQEIMENGAALGINTILWGETLAGTKAIAGNYIERDFCQRLVFHSDAETLLQLTGEDNPDSLRPTTACFRNMDADVRILHFRPYVLPVKVWVDKIAKAYKEITH